MWCGLEWTRWIPFKCPRSEWAVLPRKKPGLYRVRPVGVNLIAYIGQTGRGLRQRLGALRRHTLAELMPYNDPHTAAPNLWAWRQEEKWDYECSTAPTTCPARERMSLECYLLWQYRLEKGESTLCNHGRFHKFYRKSSPRSKGVRGDRISSGESLNPAGGLSHPPLRLQGEPLDRNWMGRQWSNMIPLASRASRAVLTTPCLYKISDLTKKRLVYIGETKNLIHRLGHHRRTFGKLATNVSFSKLSDSVRSYQRKELENDLIGGYYFQTKSVPLGQFARVLLKNRKRGEFASDITKYV